MRSNTNLLSVKSVKSLVDLFWVRLALRRVRIFCGKSALLRRGYGGEPIRPVLRNLGEGGNPQFPEPLQLSSIKLD